MKAVIQRVNNASVTVDVMRISTIGNGLLVFWVLASRIPKKIFNGYAIK